MCVLCGEFISFFYWIDRIYGSDSYGSDENLKELNVFISVNENVRECKRVWFK